MANKIHIEIACSDKNFYSGDAEMFIFRALDGDMGIMYNHQPQVALIDIGPFKLIQDGSKKIGSMAGGFAHVDGKNITVITDSVEWAEDIDIERAEKAKDRAEEKLKQKSENVDIKRAELALKRAVNRIQIAKNK